MECEALRDWIERMPVESNLENKRINKFGKFFNTRQKD